MEKEVLQIDLIYDIICPWCYVGHERLHKAIEKSNTTVQINLIPFQIRPQIPSTGQSIKDYYKNKGITDVAKAYTTVKEAAEDVGLLFEPNKFSKIPNTILLHAFILKAEEINKGAELLKAIQTAYFGKGIDLTLENNITPIVNEFLEIEVIEEILTSDKYQQKVLALESIARSKNINAVPTYVINQKHRISGAVSNFMLKDMLQQYEPKNLIGDSCDIDGNC